LKILLYLEQIFGDEESESEITESEESVEAEESESEEAEASAKNPQEDPVIFNVINKSF
jgi:hypothetical protein